MNSVNLIGRITKDPELRQSSNGKDFVGFTLAVGNKDYVQFINCIAWEKQATNLANFVKKGARISVEGSIEARQVNDNGRFNNVVTVRANRIEFLNSATTKTQQEVDSMGAPTYPLVDGLIDQEAKQPDSILWEE